MTQEEFIRYIGKDVVVDYSFGGEIQRWSMKNFCIEEGKIKHKKLPLIMDVFIKNARNPHVGEPTHGGY